MKKYLKFIIGLAVLILVACVFFFVLRSKDLESGNLRDWASASDAQRGAAVKILTGSDANNEVMIACLNKMSSMTDAAQMKIKDAASLCFIGVKLKDHGAESAAVSAK